MHFWDPFFKPSGLRECHDGNIRGSQSKMAGHKFNTVISCIVFVGTSNKKLGALGFAVEMAKEKKGTKEERGSLQSQSLLVN